MDDYPTPPPPGPPPKPVSLDDVERAGATRMGFPVRRITLVYEDGREVMIDLPTPRGAGELSPTQQRVLRILRGEREPVTRKAIAAHFGRAQATGRVGQALRELLDQGAIYESGGTLTDDPEKFKQP